MNYTIPDLPAAGTLDGSEPIETVQVIGGIPTSVRTYANAVASLAGPPGVIDGGNAGPQGGGGVIDGGGA